MPLPIILGGAALVAVAYGAKKGNDGRKTKTKAEFITQQAQKDYQQAKIAFDRENEKLSTR
ncbi:hypothetical protein [Neisseria animaloris]|uniref:hypothetical protein n=1 Tax=Neisseria animaloris TaxID=326522 RepID=UPI0019007B41|nr:hypothetical protein [Neisseria animaloris]